MRVNKFCERKMKRNENWRSKYMKDMYVQTLIFTKPSRKYSFSLAISVWSEITHKQRWQTSDINASFLEINFYLTFRMLLHTSSEVACSQALLQWDWGERGKRRKIKVCKFSLYDSKNTSDLCDEEDEQPDLACTSKLQRWHKTGRGDKICKDMIAVSYLASFAGTLCMNNLARDKT